MLDGDKAGHVAAERYRSTYLLSENEVATLDEIRPKFVGRSLETLLNKNTITNLKSQSLEKKQIGLAISEFSSKEQLYSSISEASRSAIRDIIAAITAA